MSLKKRMKKQLDGVVQNEAGEWFVKTRIPERRAFHSPTTWSPATAVRANTEMLKQSASVIGWVEAVSLVQMMEKQGEELAKAINDQDREDLAEDMYYDIVESWQKPMTILADPDFMQLVLAAAITAPTTELFPEELLSENGTVYFTENIDFSTLFKGLSPDTKAPAYFYNMFKKIPLRGIHWGPSAFDGIGIAFLADGPLIEAHENSLGYGSTKHNPKSPPERFARLAQISYSNILWKPEDDYHPTVARAVALMRSLKAISETPIAKTQMAKNPPLPKHRKRSKMKPIDVSEIRTISLRKPQVAHNEFEAATGIKQRAHWVRGHWRNQWYPSYEEHRPLWIEGHPKGDPKLGTVDSATVYLAKG